LTAASGGVLTFDLFALPMAVPLTGKSAGADLFPIQAEPRGDS